MRKGSIEISRRVQFSKVIVSTEIFGKNTANHYLHHVARMEGKKHVDGNLHDGKDGDRGFGCVVLQGQR